MASIVHRNNRFLVVHYEHDISGKNKQKWETYRTLADAKRRKAEIEHRQELGVMNVPTLILFKDGRAVERKVGLQSASDLRKLLDSVL